MKKTLKERHRHEGDHLNTTSLLQWVNNFNKRKFLFMLPILYLPIAADSCGKSCCFKSIGPYFF